MLLLKLAIMATIAVAPVTATAYAQPLQTVEQDEEQQAAYEACLAEYRNRGFDDNTGYNACYSE